MIDPDLVAAGIARMEVGEEEEQISTNKGELSQTVPDVKITPTFQGRSWGMRMGWLLLLSLSSWSC